MAAYDITKEQFKGTKTISLAKDDVVRIIIDPSGINYIAFLLTSTSAPTVPISWSTAEFTVARDIKFEIQIGTVTHTFIDDLDNIYDELPFEFF